MGDEPPRPALPAPLDVLDGVASSYLDVGHEQQQDDRLRHLGVVLDDGAAETRRRIRGVERLVELWQGRQSRLHDRLCYRRGDDGWTVERLAP